MQKRAFLQLVQNDQKENPINNFGYYSSSALLMSSAEKYVSWVKCSK